MNAAAAWTKLRHRLQPAYWIARGSRPFVARGHRASLVKALTRLLPRREIAGVSRWPSLDEGGLAAALDKDGYCELGRLFTDEEVDELVAFAGTLRWTDPWKPENTGVRIEEAPPETHTAQYPRSLLAGSDRILDIANDPGVLRIAGRFLGATPTLSNLTMWWSLAGCAAPEQAQMFHRDYDDLKFCKLFIYLTDVDLRSGPHVYVRGSARRDDVFVSDEPYAVRLTDEEVESAFGRDRIVHFCAPRGTAFLVDTFGVHKGLLPLDRNRLLLQIEYSLLPIGHEPYFRDVKRPYEGERRRFDPWVNRLLLKTRRV